MKQLINAIGRVVLGFSIVLGIVLISGCSKQDSQIVGTGVGAALGAEMAGRDDKILGAAAGALAGNWLGKKVGEAVEEEKEMERERRAHCDKVRRLRAENSRLKQEQQCTQKYCPSCREWLKIRGANTCPFCGTGLVIEKYCRKCCRTCDASSTHKYCSNCVGGVRLRYR